MDEKPGATILPFRAKPAAVTLGKGRDLDASAAQLSEALNSLSAALQEQHAVAQQWRDAVAGLSANLRALGRIAAPATHRQPRV